MSEPSMIIDNLIESDEEFIENTFFFHPETEEGFIYVEGKWRCIGKKLTDIVKEQMEKASCSECRNPDSTQQVPAA